VTKREFLTIMGLLSAGTRTEVSESTTEAYWEMLQDLDGGLTLLAAKKLLASEAKPFFPAIGAIRRAVAEISSPDGLTPGDAWGFVKKAITRFGYYREEEALNWVPPLVARAIRNIGWQDICMSEEPEIVRAQFMRVFAQRQEAEREVAALPVDVRRAMEGNLSKALSERNSDDGSAPNGSERIAKTAG